MLQNEQRQVWPAPAAANARVERGTAIVLEEKPAEHTAGHFRGHVSNEDA